MSKDFDDEYIKTMYQKAFAGNDGTGYSLDPKYDEERIEGLKMYKRMMYSHLKSIEERYGKLLSQMHPDDILEHIGAEQLQSDAGFVQDASQLYQEDNGEYLNQRLQFGHDEGFGTEEEEKDYRRLNDIYQYPLRMLSVLPLLSVGKDRETYRGAIFDAKKEMAKNDHSDEIKIGPHLSKQEKARYDKMIQKKIKKGKYLDYSKNPEEA